MRMYNVGFGDAFLVEIPGNSTTHRILFDCGSIQASPEGGAKVVKTLSSPTVVPASLSATTR